MSLANSTRVVLVDIALERERQDRKFPGQRNVDGTGPKSRARHWLPATATVRAHVDAAAKAGTLDDASVLLEEVCEALDETVPAKLRAELVQVGSVSTRWVERLDAEAAARGESLVPERPPAASVGAGRRAQTVDALRATNRRLERELFEARHWGHNLVARLNTSPNQGPQSLPEGWDEWLVAHAHHWRRDETAKTLPVAALRCRDAASELAVRLADEVQHGASRGDILAALALVHPALPRRAP